LVDIVYRDNRWFFFANGKTVGPFESLKDADPVAVAANLSGVEGDFTDLLKVPAEQVSLWSVKPQEILRLKLSVSSHLGGLEKPKPKRERAVPLSHISMIEDPSYAGKPISVEAVVSSTSIAYLTPSLIEVADDKNSLWSSAVPADDPLNVQLIGVGEQIKHKRLKEYLGVENEARVAEKAYRTVYRIRVRPPVFTLEKRGEKIMDERGFEYKAFDIYVATEKPIVFQPSGLIRVEGLPMPSPRTQQLTILAYNACFPEENLQYDVEKLKTLKEKLSPLNVKERVKWLLGGFELYSNIIGRRNLAFAGLLAFFTPTWVRLNGEIQRGWANIIFCGDTTTAKTETVRKLLMLLKNGILVTAETASTVGLTGTATQVEREGWFVDWGFLVLCDRKLLAIDGVHKLNLSNWAALGETERSGVVTIAKAAKNTAYARTRQIKIANPVDRTSDRYSTKTMSSFLYPCQALSTILDKVSIARLDLAVFADQRDVKAEEINRRAGNTWDTELGALSEALKWCWSDFAEVSFTDEAVETIHHHATELYNRFFYDEIPLASIDLKWKLARLSASLAYMTLSTEDFSKVNVKGEHVTEVVSFLEEEYTKVGLNILAQASQHENLTEDDAKQIAANVVAQLKDKIEEQKIAKVLRYIVLKGRVTRDEILSVFNLAENTQLRPLLATLTGEGLVKSGRGFYPETKLVQAYKLTDGFSKIKLEKEGS